MGSGRTFRKIASLCITVFVVGSERSTDEASITLRERPGLPGSDAESENDI